MGVSKKQYRNLAQFRDLPEDEFEEKWIAYKTKQELESNLDDDRIKEIMDLFEQEYDLSDMNINDKLSLEQIAKNTVFLDLINDLWLKAIEDSDKQGVQKYAGVVKDITSTISSLQSDLGITRKNRQASAGESLEDYLPEIQKKARSFLQERLAYVYCPKCSMLVANAWFASWKDPNELNVVCPRETCRHQFTVTSKHLTNNRNKNVDHVLEV